MAKKANGFRLDGKPFAVRATPKAVLKIREFLAKQPIGDLLTTQELASRVGYCTGHLMSNVIAHPELLPFRARVRYPQMMSVWGSKKTITQLAKHKELLA